MPNRRAFLQGGLCVLSLPWPTWAASLSGRIRFIVDGRCPDARAFAEAGRGECAGITDPAALFGQFERSSDSTTVWFGLTGDAQHFVLRELGAARGYRLSYRGTHDYRSGGLIHTLDGNVVVAHTARALAAAGAAWARTLIDSSTRLACADSALRESARVATTLARPADSPGYLVSWCLRRA
jgi:hypothetical protein